jgi:hypothetical protein
VVKTFDERTGAKTIWVRPQLQRLRAGAAESGEGTVADNSAPQKS